MPSATEARRLAAFTLVELILVMALLATLLAFAAPLLSNSLRGRGLDGEASRFLALTEYARSEAVAQGVPMVVWIEPDTRHYGSESKAGYDGIASRERDYPLVAEADIEVVNGERKIGDRVNAIQFGPDGMPDTVSAEEVRFIDRTGARVAVTRTTDGWGYEITKPAK